MKKLLILAMVLVITAAGAAYAAHNSGMIAQAEAPATQLAPPPGDQPAATPAEPAPQQEAVPSSAAPAPASAASTTSSPIASAPLSPATQQEAAPVPAWQPASSATSTIAPKEGFMVQQMSHKNFATMDLKECAKCHEGSGVAPTHGSDQMREHSFLARRAGKNCTDCHNQQFCLDCHKGGGIDADLNVSNYRTSYVPKTHRTDFREIHPLKALDNPQSCYRCHDTKYCSECHAKFKGADLMIQSHRTAWSDLQAGNPGPVHATFTAAQCQTCHPGGLLPKHVWSADHAQEARRNLQACQTCHSDGDVCMTCHSARRGLMVNPHPREWNSVKNRFRAKGGGRSCIKCHDNY